MKEIFRSMVSGLSDSSLENLKAAVFEEESERISRKILSGNFVNPTEEMLEMVKRRDVIAFCRAYREEWECSLRFAKEVFDKFCEDNKREQNN